MHTTPSACAHASRGRARCGQHMRSRQLDEAPHANDMACATHQDVLVARGGARRAQAGCGGHGEGPGYPSPADALLTPPSGLRVLRRWAHTTRRPPLVSTRQPHAPGRRLRQHSTVRCYGRRVVAARHEAAARRCRRGLHAPSFRLSSAETKCAPADAQTLAPRGPRVILLQKRLNLGASAFSEQRMTAEQR